MKQVVEDLDEVLPDDRILYLPRREGGFFLSAGLLEQRERNDEEIAAISRRQGEAERKLLEYEISDQCRAALKAAGVRSELSAAASALFRQTFPVSKSESDGRLSAGPHGAALEFAVDAWLGSDAGAAYRRASVRAETEPVERKYRAQIEAMCKR